MLRDIFAAILSKVAEWKANKEAVLRGDITQTTEPVEEDIYAVKEVVSNNNNKSFIADVVVVHSKTQYIKSYTIESVSVYKV